MFILWLFISLLHMRASTETNLLALVSTDIPRKFNFTCFNWHIELSQILASGSYTVAYPYAN